jgi:phytoene dehydrogenase-like protein
VHLALNGLPQFKGITDPRELGARLIVATSSASVDDAFNPVKYQQMSEQPILECHIPTIHDESMAPAGQHVLSAIVQYVPYSSNIPQAELRELVLSRVIHQLERVAPDIRQKIVASECFTPRDIETRFRMPQGHWHHAEMTIDQALMLRPIPQLAQYRGPIKRLWLCGASTHPGGGVMGLSAQNMAKVVAEDIV